MTAPVWFGTGPGLAGEPPASVLQVVDQHDGKVMDRVGDCEHCPGGRWRWRHNGGEDCWMDMDGIGPYEEVRPPGTL